MSHEIFPQEIRFNLKINSTYFRRITEEISPDEYVRGSELQFGSQKWDNREKKGIGVFGELNTRYENPVERFIDVLPAVGEITYEGYELSPNLGAPQYFSFRVYTDIQGNVTEIQQDHRPVELSGIGVAWQKTIIVRNDDETYTAVSQLMVTPNITYGFTSQTDTPVFRLQVNLNEYGVVADGLIKFGLNSYNPVDGSEVLTWKHQTEDILTALSQPWNIKINNRIVSISPVLTPLDINLILEGKSPLDPSRQMDYSRPLVGIRYTVR